MRVVLLGPPGAGKTDIAKLITDTFGYPSIHVARELAAIAAESNYLDSLAVQPMLAGRIADDILLPYLETRFQDDDVDDGFVIVDFPRESRQAPELDGLLEQLRLPIDLVLMLDVESDELMERLVGQIGCDSCGAKYNLYINPPLVEGVCDTCGSKVRVRPEDYEESIANKIRVYEMQVGPILKYYTLHGKLRRVNGEAESIQAVWDNVRHIIESTPPTIIEAEPVSEDAVSIDSADAEKIKSVKKKKVTGKKRVIKKKLAPKKKAVTKKKPVARKSTTKKPVVKKKVAKKKPVVKKAPVKKKPVVKKKAVAKKKPVAKKSAVTKKKPVARKKVVAKKKPVVKKKALIKKKEAVRKKKPAVTKKVAPKKKSAKKKATKKKARK